MDRAEGSMPGQGLGGVVEHDLVATGVGEAGPGLSMPPGGYQNQERRDSSYKYRTGVGQAGGG
ncbi:hypothetical protein WDZ92_03940 [Nostoc sp. NIES-2111]